MDSDGDDDLICAGYDSIYWVENTGELDWIAHDFVTDCDAGLSLFATENIDGDTDDDIVIRCNSELKWIEIIDAVAMEYAIHSIADDAPDIFTNSALCDMDGDFDLDVIASSSTMNLFLFRNVDGLGSFNDGEYIAETGSFNFIETADVDSDADNDIIISYDEYSPIHGIRWFENTDGTGTAFTAHIVSTSPEDFNDLQIADIENDGDTDIFAVSVSEDYFGYVTNNLIRFENTGSGNFNDEVIIDTLVYMASIATADMNADSLVDIVANNSNILSIYPLQSSFIDFSTPDTIYKNYNRWFNIVSADLEGDGDKDLVVASTNGVVSAFIYDNLIDSFTIKYSVDSIVLGTHQALAVSDIDGNGFADILSSCIVGYDAVINIYKNYGSGVFIPENHYGDYSFMECWFIDIDEDGDTDVIGEVVKYGWGLFELHWYENVAGYFDFSAPTVLLTSENYVKYTINLFDYDSDGDDDIVHQCNAPYSGLCFIENLPGSEFEFESEWIDTDAGLILGAPQFSDADNDGDKDLFCKNNVNHLLIFENTGVGTFDTYDDCYGYYLYYDGTVTDPFFTDFNFDYMEDVIFGYKTHDKEHTDIYMNLEGSLCSYDIIPFLDDYGIFIYQDADATPDLIACNPYRLYMLPDVYIDIDDSGIPKMNLSDTSEIIIAEGGTEFILSIALQTPPEDTVKITVQPDIQLDLGAGPGLNTQVVFLPASAETMNISITATDDIAVEGLHNGHLEFEITTEDEYYSHFQLSPAIAIIEDNDPTAIDYHAASAFSIYPNPATSLLSIILNEVDGKSKVIISDSYGRCVFTKDNIHENQFSIDVSVLPAGIYAVAVISPNNIYTKNVYVAPDLR